MKQADTDRVLSQIEADFFTPFAKTIGINRDGENVIKDNRFLMSTTTNGKPDASALTHEIAHMIEIDPYRCHKPGWGLRTGPEFYFPGHGIVRNGMTTKKAAEREIRVFGIQMVLDQHYGIPVDELHLRLHPNTRDSAYHALVVVHHIEATWHYYPKGWMKDDRGLTNHENYAKAVVEHRIIRESEKWDFETIQACWIRRMCQLRRKQAAGCWRNYD